MASCREEVDINNFASLDKVRTWFLFTAHASFSGVSRLKVIKNGLGT